VPQGNPLRHRHNRDVGMTVVMPMSALRRFMEHQAPADSSRSVTALAVAHQHPGATATTQHLHQRCRSRRTSYPQSEAVFTGLHCALLRSLAAAMAAEVGRV
jgi:hypothetical protein